MLVAVCPQFERRCASSFLSLYSSSGPKLIPLSHKADEKLLVQRHQKKPNTGVVQCIDPINLLCPSHVEDGLGLSWGGLSAQVR